MVLALICSGLIAAGPVVESEPPLVPWYVPRSATLGLFINRPMVAPHFRLTWEAAIISQPRNDLIWLLSVGSAVGVGMQVPMTAHYQHVLLAGFGYRSDHPLLHWGFHVVTGPVWYRASYEPGAFYKFESRVLGYIEGRAQLGIRIAGHLKLAVYFGYASPFFFAAQFPGNTFVGGFDTGLVLDWR